VDVFLFLQKFDFCTLFLEFFDYKHEVKIRQIFFIPINKNLHQKWYKNIILVVFCTFKLKFFIDFSKSLFLTKIDIFIFCHFSTNFDYFFSLKRFSWAIDHGESEKIVYFNRRLSYFENF
jgi:hypothetical protein